MQITNICLKFHQLKVLVTVHGILQARILEWVAIPFSRRSSQPRDQTWVSCTAGGFFTDWATLSQSLMIDYVFNNSFVLDQRLPHYFSLIPIAIKLQKAEILLHFTFYKTVLLFSNLYPIQIFPFYLNCKDYITLKYKKCNVLLFPKWSFI